ncbi:MAG: helix-turn-helix domain-containing protein [Burkholderiaceae bacterium]|nr:helix-turn-helix domain-containing protein [Burkholderiaceae bacterium]
MIAHTPKKSNSEDWHPADIKAELAKIGVTLSRIAFDAELSDSSSLSACLKRPMPVNEKRIADALGVKPSVIWPSRYDENGEPLKRGRNATAITAEMRANKSKSVKAAAKKAGVSTSAH